MKREEAEKCEHGYLAASISTPPENNIVSAMLCHRYGAFGDVLSLDFVKHNACTSIQKGLFWSHLTIALFATWYHGIRIFQVYFF